MVVEYPCIPQNDAGPVVNGSGYFEGMKPMTKCHFSEDGFPQLHSRENIRIRNLIVVFRRKRNSWIYKRDNRQTF